MNDDHILAIIKDALNEVAPDRAEQFTSVQLDTDIDSLGLDSVATMEMVGSIEDKVDAVFADEELAKVHRLRDFAALIREGRVSAA